MRGSKDLARVESLTRSGTAGGMGGTKRTRKMDMESKERRMVRMVEDLVLVMRSILSRRKLKKAMKGSRCWTSALTAKRMSGREASAKLERIRWNESSTVVVVAAVMIV
jgi:hypothetical protein